MAYALVIDTDRRVVRQVTLPPDEETRLAVLNRSVGGYLEAAYMWPGTGDVLFVDEDGLRHDWPVGFVFLPPQIGARPRTILGSGVVVGREVEGQWYRDGWANLDPAITAEELLAIVRFIQR